MTKGLLFTLVAAAMIGSGCGSTPTTPTTVVTPVTETFTSFIYPQGSASQMFTAAQAGTVSITLSSLISATTAGVGVGITDVGGAGCHLTTSIDTAAAATPQLTVAVDAGSYCVKIFDTGNVSGVASFSITIVRP